MMCSLAEGMVGVRFTCKDLTADNGIDNFARSVNGSIWDVQRIRKNAIMSEVQALRKMMYENKKNEGGVIYAF